MKKIDTYFIRSFCFLLLLPTMFFSSTANAQYCVGSNLGGGGCSAGDLITSVVIAGTNFNSTGAFCTTTANGDLTVFPDTGSATTSLMQGQTYSLSVTTDANQIVSVWIDYNHDLVYDASEWTQVCLSSAGGVPNIVSITIPFAPFSGLTGMRIRSRASGAANGANDACSQFFSGEAEEYLITIAAGTACTAPPTAGTTLGVPSACIGTKTVLSLSGNSIGSGQTYQWQSSPDNISWTSISGATNTTYVDSVIAPLYFQCVVTCSGQSANSAPVLVGVTPANQCYCASFATNTVDDDIGNVSIASLNNGNGTPTLSNPTSVNTYTDFTTSLPATDLLSGLPYPISITQINSGTFYACFATVHIDFNQDGQFDTTEVFPIGLTAAAQGANVLNGSITIPNTAQIGITRMRIVLRENGFAKQSACGSYTYGETEDYLINIVAATPCTAPPTAGTSQASSSLVCNSSSINLTLTGNSIGIGQTYQWQYSADNINWTPIALATSQNASVVVSGLSYYRCEVACSGNSVTSAVTTVSIKPLIQCYCTSNATNTVDDDLGWFEFGSLLISGDTTARSNPTSIQTYSNFTNFTPVSFSQGATYPIKAVQINSSASFYVCILNVFMDYNQDGVYDSTEVIFADTTNNTAGGNLLQGSVTIPSNATIGNTGLRAVLKETTAPLSPCGTYGYGETEDYIAYIDFPLTAKSISQNTTLAAIPNPASDKIMLTFNNAEAENSQLKLTNLSGQLVYTETLNHFSGKYTKTLDVSSFAKGIYNLQLISTKGVTTKKVVIK